MTPRYIATTSDTRSRPIRELVLLVSFIILAACGSRPEVGALALSEVPAQGAETHDILVVTTRERDSRPDTYFNGERSQQTSYAQASISVPPSHEISQVEWPDKLPGNPETDFVARSASYIEDKSAFTRELNAKLAKLPKGKREVFLFIHGYNTLFPEALYRFVQVVHDGDIEAVPVLFTWASRGKLQDYVYDLNSAAIARQALAETMLQLSKSNAEKITVLAHSMGNWLLMETAIQSSPAQRKALEGKVDVAILAAPDIDIDLFKAQLRKLGTPANPYVVVVSRDDRALRLSRAIAGGKERVGAYSNDAELAELGAIVIDVTELDSLDAANHSKFAQLAQLSPEFRKTLGQTGLRSASDTARGAKLGDSLGTFVGNTVALPVNIITAPFTYSGGG
ncbi:alpha/beta hydrolase [uncultured Roseibium sp.]|uniref:alpha/beta hydrolase n=1 Tax=uncultured Roseibium sp. TaxID=1936171 RepID=UPI00262260BE|nr:alpha/beta hydrolase [uncultured Roseibium sp.]